MKTANDLFLQRIKDVEERVKTIEESLNSSQAKRTWTDRSGRFNGHKLTLDSIGEVVASFYGTSVKIIQSGSREGRLMLIRQVYCYFAYNNRHRVGGANAIGRWMQYETSTPGQNIRHNALEIQGRIDYEKGLRHDVQEINNTLNQMI